MENNIQGYCVKCKTKRNAINPIYTKTNKGVNMMQGICEVCSTKISVMLPKNTQVQEIGASEHKETTAPIIPQPKQEIKELPATKEEVINTFKKHYPALNQYEPKEELIPSTSLFNYNQKPTQPKDKNYFWMIFGLSCVVLFIAFGSITIMTISKIELNPSIYINPNSTTIIDNNVIQPTIEVPRYINVTRYIYKNGTIGNN